MRQISQCEDPVLKCLFSFALVFKKKKRSINLLVAVLLDVFNDPDNCRVCVREDYLVTLSMWSRKGHACSHSWQAFMVVVKDTFNDLRIQRASDSPYQLNALFMSWFNDLDNEVTIYNNLIFLQSSLVVIGLKSAHTHIHTQSLSVILTSSCWECAVSVSIYGPGCLN